MLLSRADDHRRRGELEAAAKVYAAVAAHADGAAYAEEAMLRRARMLRASGDLSGAVAVAQSAAARFPRGALSPERAAFHSAVLIELGAAPRAAGVLDALGAEVRTEAVQQARIDAARVLVRDDPDRARRLIEPVLQAPWSPKLSRAAKRIASEVAAEKK